MRSVDAPRDSGACVFGPSEIAEARALVELAVAEDLPDGDLTSRALLADLREPPARWVFVSREDGVFCGAEVVRLVYERIDPAVRVDAAAGDGESVAAGARLLEVVGPPESVLSGERIALNFLQRLSGISTMTRRWVDRLAGTNATLLDTRKTTPGWRHLEKYAVRRGGATNHRPDLSSAFLLKDNHASILRAAGRGELSDWVVQMRAYAPDRFVEVEVDSRDEFLEALTSNVDAILLDNFSLDDLVWAVAKRDEASSREALPGEALPGAGESARAGPHASGPLLEASGGVRFETVRSIAETGVDRISVGALTHSVRSLDIGLDDPSAKCSSREGC